MNVKEKSSIVCGWPTRFLAVAVVGTALSAQAASFHIKPGKEGRWNEPSSYYENDADGGTRLPDEGDFIYVKKGETVEMNDADCVFLTSTAKIGALYFSGTDESRAVIVATIEGDGTELACIIADQNVSSRGSFVKEGSGRLYLSKTGPYVLQTDYVINDGILQFPVNESASSSNQHVDSITVNSPGVLWGKVRKDASCGAPCIFFRQGLWGDGVVTNPSPAGCKTAMRLFGNAEHGQSVFSGSVAGDFEIYCLEEGVNCLTGTSSVTNDIRIFDTAKLYLSKIGGGDGGTNAYGSAGSGVFRIGTATTLGYLGSGETTYAQIKNSTYTGHRITRSFTLDGGPNGGLDFAGEISLTSVTNATFDMILDGTNANDCTFSGAIVLSDKLEDISLRLVKRGSGTWAMENNPDSTVNGVVAVEEGVLQVDEIAYAGKNCALGTADYLVEDCEKLPEEAQKVPYAVLLGKEQGRKGMLEYTGDDEQIVFTRPIALAGEGALKSDNAQLLWRGVGAADSGDKTLVLDGEASGSTVYDITNGVGKVSVVKEGSGSWTLGGTLDFTGGITVKEGELSISSAEHCYRWYRFVFKEVLNGERLIEIGRLGLFNKDGIIQCANMRSNTAAVAEFTLLHPGEAVLTSMGANPFKQAQNLRQKELYYLFTPTNSMTFHWCSRLANSFGNEEPSLTNQESWFVVMVRLPAAADPVCSYDIGSRWMIGNDRYGRVPASWSVEGSLDGVSWTELSSVVSVTNSIDHWKKTCYWMKANTPYFTTDGKCDPLAPNTNGWEIASGVAPESTLDGGIDDLSVASGASLVSDKTVTARKVTVDVAGMGSVSGFALADNGVIDIVNAPESGKFEVATCFSGITLPEEYSFTVNGEPTRRSVRLSADGTKISVNPRGLVIGIR